MSTNVNLTNQNPSVPGDGGPVPGVGQGEPSIFDENVSTPTPSAGPSPMPTPAPTPEAVVLNGHIMEEAVSEVGPTEAEMLQRVDDWIKTNHGIEKVNFSYVCSKDDDGRPRPHEGYKEVLLNDIEDPIRTYIIRLAAAGVFDGDDGLDYFYFKSEEDDAAMLVMQTVDRMIAKGSIRLNDQGEVVTVSDETLRSASRLDVDGDDRKFFTRCNADGDTILVSDDTVLVWRQELSKMKPKKRKNWKGSLTDSNGVSTKLKYDVKNDCFLNYSIKVGKFVRVTTISELQTKGGGIKNLIAHTPVGVAIKSGFEAGVDNTVEVMQAAVDSNHTGNHYRNTSVKVPVSVYG